MVKDSEFSGTAMGFRASLRELEKNAVSEDLRRKKLRDETALLDAFEEAQRKKVLDELNNPPQNVTPHKPRSFLPGPKTFIGVSFAASMFALVNNPETAGQIIGDASAGYTAATTQQKLCDKDCSIPRIAGEKAGGWTVQFEKGFNSRFTQ